MVVLARHSLAGVIQICTGADEPMLGMLDAVSTGHSILHLVREPSGGCKRLELPREGSGALGRAPIQDHRSDVSRDGLPVLLPALFQTDFVER
eukprot:8385228-Ditylum_brightwellii.AAC.1